MVANVEEYEKESNYFKEHGETSEAFKVKDDEISIEYFDHLIEVTKEGIKDVDEFKETAVVSIVPLLITSLKTLIENPDTLQAARALQYTALIKLRGQMMFTLQTLMSGGRMFYIVEREGFFYSVLSRLLKFYLKYYEYRIKYKMESRLLIIDPSHVLICFDSEMRIITDVSCPQLLLKNNKNSLFNLDLGLILKDGGFDVSVNNETVQVAEVEDTNPFQDVIASELPGHTTAIYKSSWTQELQAMLKIILTLATSVEKFSEERVGDLCDKIFMLVNEGVTLTPSQVRMLVGEEASELAVGLVHILLSDESGEGTLFVKTDFGTDVERMLRFITQCVEGE
jgi:hypothetical protein